MDTEGVSALATSLGEVRDVLIPLRCAGTAELDDPDAGAAAVAVAEFLLATDSALLSFAGQVDYIGTLAHRAASQWAATEARAALAMSEQARRWHVAVRDE